MKIIVGQILKFNNNPFNNRLNTSFEVIKRGGIVIENNLIKEVGKLNVLRIKYPNAKLFDYGSHLISAGFIDAHMHYSQTGIIASWGKRLIDWLNTYTFPGRRSDLILFK